MIPFVVQAADVLVEQLASAVTMADQGWTATVGVFGRDLQATDPDLSIGVVPLQWTPGSQSIGGNEPDYGRYIFSVTTMLKAPTRIVGERLSGIFVGRVRNALYRHKPLLDALQAVSALDDVTDMRERYLKHGLSNIDFADSAVSKGFVFFSQAEFFIESEVA